MAIDGRIRTRSRKENLNRDRTSDAQPVFDPVRVTELKRRKLKLKEELEARRTSV
jgi:hypothetical protein